MFNSISEKNSKLDKLRKNRRLFVFLLVFGFMLAQCSIVFAEANHPFHQPDAKCTVCLVAGHLSHALANAGLSLFIDRYVPLPVNDPIASLAIPFNVQYLIRAPPLS